MCNREMAEHLVLLYCSTCITITGLSHKVSNTKQEKKEGGGGRTGYE